MVTPARWLCAAAAAATLLVLASCAGSLSPGVTGDPSLAVPAPIYRVGDRWIYRVRDGFSSPQIYEETHTVTSLGADGATVRVAIKGPKTDFERTERWAAAGKVSQGSLFDIETRRFREPLERYRFPLQPGASWSQFVDNYNELTQKEGRINHYVRVGGREPITTPAGTFDAIRLNVFMHLDDEEFWRTQTDCNYQVWYAPSVKGVVREVRRADYSHKPIGREGIGRLPAQYTIVELVSFTPGA
jgi:hypothetical protein